MITTKLKTLFGPAGPKRPKKWEIRQEDFPWFDQPDALDLLESRRRRGDINDQQHEWLRKWVVDGYFVAQNLIEPELVNGMLQDLDAVWSAQTPIEGLRIEDVKLKPDDPIGFPHSKLVTLDLPTRERLKSAGKWRILNFWQYSKNTKAIKDNPKIIELASLILDRPALPHYTINFTFGSRQKLHQDMAVFHILPLNFLVGVWLACEDISAESGPLVFYPGSHKEPMFPAFDNYPQTNLKTCDADATAGYEAYLDRLSKKYERKTFLAKKGEILFWHGMLFHGGDNVVNPALTRKSYVCHYIPDGMNRETDMVGPFNW